MPRYTISVYGGDVGGLDLDFEAETQEEALAIARKETPKGTRGTEIYDNETGELVGVLYNG